MDLKQVFYVITQPLVWSICVSFYVLKLRISWYNILGLIGTVLVETRGFQLMLISDTDNVIAITDKENVVHRD